jgi:hypothetical protein
LACAWAAVAHADAPDSQSVSLLPWSGAFLQFSQNKQLIDLSLAGYLDETKQLFGHIEVTAPLDESTREAAFIDGNRPAAPFSLAVSLSHDSRMDWKRGLRVGVPILTSMCNDLGINPCTSETLEKELGINDQGAVLFLPAAQRACEDAKNSPCDAGSVRALIARAAAVNQARADFSPDAGLTDDIQSVCTAEKIAPCGAAGLQSAANELSKSIQKEKLALGRNLRAAAAQELGRYVIPQEGTYWSYGVDARLSYDRVSAYRDITMPTQSFDNLRIDAGGQLTHYRGANWAFKLAAGYSGEQQATVKQITRCIAVPSSDSSITGQSCDDSALLLVAAPTFVNRGYARLGVTWLSSRSFAGADGTKLTPGVEVRAGADELGGDATFSTRFTLFVQPAVGPILTRTGIGIDLSWALTNASDGSFGRGDLRQAVPFAFLGASL